MSDEIQDLRDAIRTYCDVSAGDYDGWLDDLEAPNGEEWRAHMRTLLDKTIEQKLLTRADFERLTNDYFSTDAEFEAYLLRLRKFLFEGGRHPFYLGDKEEGE